jgi:hypothetical protein
VASQQHDKAPDDLPADLPSPARRALAAAGYARLEQLTQVSEAELGRLHGVGPRALGRLRRALAASGRSFASAGRSRPGRLRSPA